MGKKKSRSKNVSLTDVQKVLGSVQSELDEIKAIRDQLQEELEQLDERISHVEGVGGGVSAAPRPATAKGKKTTRKKKAAGRPPKKKTSKGVTRKKKTSRGKRKGPSARSLAMEFLEQEKSGLTIDELTSKIEATGYKSKSDDFKTVLYQTLYAARKNGEVKYDEKNRIYKKA